MPYCNYYLLFLLLLLLFALFGQADLCFIIILYVKESRQEDVGLVFDPLIPPGWLVKE